MDLNKLLLTVLIINKTLQKFTTEFSSKSITQEYIIKIITEDNIKIKTMIENISFKITGIDAPKLIGNSDERDCKELCNTPLDFSKIIVLEKKHNESIDEVVFNENEYDKVQEFQYVIGENDQAHFELECKDCYYTFDGLILNENVYFFVKKLMLDLILI